MAAEADGLTENGLRKEKKETRKGEKKGGKASCPKADGTDFGRGIRSRGKDELIILKTFHKEKGNAKKLGSQAQFTREKHQFANNWWVEVERNTRGSKGV